MSLQPRSRSRTALLVYWAPVLLLLLTSLLSPAGALPAAAQDASANPPVTVSFPGNYGQAIGAPSWTPDDPAVRATDADGDGVHELALVLPRGDYEFKVAIDGAWDENYGLNAMPDGPNIPFSVAEEATVLFRFALADKAITVSVGEVVVVSDGAPVEATPLQPQVARGDGAIDALAIVHDSRGDAYRSPAGAVPFDTAVTLRLRTAADDVERVTLLLDELETSTASSLPMAKVAAQGGMEWWEVTLDSGATPAIWNYKFALTDGNATIYYAELAADGGEGVVAQVRPQPWEGWDIYTYRADFAAPEWAANAIIYQIFPDRFRNGDPTNDPAAGDFGYPEERGQVFPISPWNTIVPDPDPYDPDKNPDWYATWNATFYGGDLQGVLEKLDYLQALGVNTIYFTPIHEAVTNHRYDARDFRLVDDNLAIKGDPAASMEFFRDFAAAVDERGMRLILDAVPNHTSSDSPAFDKYGRYETDGACESLDSPTRDLYLFDPARVEGQGSCAGDTDYRSFAGVATLPQQNTANAAVMEDWLEEEGIANFWLDIPGVAGWRVDTVPDVVAINPTFFEPFRSVVKAVHPDALLVAETWPENMVRARVLGDEFDTTMNYRFARAVLGFLRDTPFTETNDGEITPLSASEFEATLRSIEEDYPPAAFASAMNLLSSHDFQRATRTLDHDGVDLQAMRPVDGFSDGRARLALAAVLQFTLPGAPTVFYGDEIGLAGFGTDLTRDDPHNRQPYPWEDADGFAELPDWRKPDTALLAHYQALGTLRSQHSFLRTGTWKTLLVDDAGVLVYERRDPSGVAIVAINRSSEPYAAEVHASGALPAGLELAGFAGGEAAVVDDSGMVAFDVPALGFRILVSEEGGALNPPAAPEIAGIAGNGIVTLTVSETADAARIVFERSVVQGGFAAIATLPAEDAILVEAAANGSTIYYRVRAVGANGLLSAPSAPVELLPFAPVASALMGGPTALEHTISAITPTLPISGVVVVPGVSEAVGPAAGLLAELGYAPAGSETWRWTPATFLADTLEGEAWMAKLLPDAVGEYVTRWRFSTTGGRAWSESTDGALTVLPAEDTLPPKPPFRMDELGRSGSQLVFAWRLSRPRDLHSFRICRADLTAGETGCATEIVVPKAGTIYTDTTVTTAHTYSYTVRVVDTAFNVSEPSAALTMTAELTMVPVTIRVLVPPGTPADAQIYIAGDNPDVFGAAFDPARAPLQNMGDGIWQGEALVKDGLTLQYKYTRGSWETVEQWGTIAGFNNRKVTIVKGADGTMLIEDTATDWGADGPDDRRGVQAWRDPLVTSTEPAPDSTGPVESVRVGFSIFVSAPDPAAVINVANANGALVPGSVSADGIDAFVWTPAAPLAPGKYTATAFNAEQSTPMLEPYVWSFTVE